MNRFLILFLMALVLVSSALASMSNCSNGVGGNFGTVYTNGGLANGYSCMSGNLIFSNFLYSGSANPNGLTIPATGITVTALTMTGNEGLQFQSGWNVSSQSGVSNFQDSFISFTVTGPLTDLHLSFNGTGLAPVTGLANVVEHYCLNTTAGTGGCGAANAGQFMVTNPPPASNTDAGVLFATSNPGITVTSLSVTKDINVTSGVNGNASISVVQNTFSNGAMGGVPEPLSFVLLGSGLLGLGLLRKRIYKR